MSEVEVFIQSLYQEGIAYYHRLLDALEEASIEPVVTLYHWDLPQVPRFRNRLILENKALEDQGGWLNSSASLWFEEYSTVCFEVRRQFCISQYLNIS